MFQWRHFGMRTDMLSHQCGPDFSTLAFFPVFAGHLPECSRYISNQTAVCYVRTVGCVKTGNGIVFVHGSSVMVRDQYRCRRFY